MERENMDTYHSFYSIYDWLTWIERKCSLKQLEVIVGAMIAGYDFKFILLLTQEKENGNLLLSAEQMRRVVAGIEQGLTLDELSIFVKRKLNGKPFFTPEQMEILMTAVANHWATPEQINYLMSTRPDGALLFTTEQLRSIFEGKQRVEEERFNAVTKQTDGMGIPIFSAEEMKILLWSDCTIGQVKVLAQVRRNRTKTSFSLSQMRVVVSLVEQGELTKPQFNLLTATREDKSSIYSFQQMEVIAASWRARLPQEQIAFLTRRNQNNWPVFSAEQMKVIACSPWEQIKYLTAQTWGGNQRVSCEQLPVLLEAIKRGKISWEQLEAFFDSSFSAPVLQWCISQVERGVPLEIVLSLF